MNPKWRASPLIVALVLLAGPVVLASSPDGTPSTAVSRDGADDSLVCADAVDTADAPRRDDRSVTIGLAVRWGYLGDPAVAFLEGRGRGGRGGRAPPFARSAGRAGGPGGWAETISWTAGRTARRSRGGPRRP